MRKLRGVYSDALRAASCLGEFIALGQSHTPFSVIGDWSVSLSKETLRVWSRHRTGARVALQQVPYPPARRFDCPQGVAEVNQVVYLLSSNCAAISIGAA
jgi:hypothetical protein